MQIARAHFEFQKRLNKTHTSGNPNFLDYEIDALLDRAQLEIIGGYYTHGREKGSGFEASTMAIAALANVTIKSPGPQGALVPTEIGAADSGLYELNLGDLVHDIAFPVKVMLDIRLDNCTKRITWELWQHDDVKNRVNQPSWTYGRVHANFGLATVPGNPGSTLPRFTSLYLDTTDVRGIKQYEVINVYVTYIKRPALPWLGTYDLTGDLLPTGSSTEIIYEAGVDNPVGFELEEFFHKQIVNIAADLAVSDLRRMTGNPT